MNITEIRHGFLVLDSGRTRYCSSIGNGKHICHWTFLPRLSENRDLRISDEVRAEIARLVQERRNILDAKKNEYPGVEHLFGKYKPFPYQYAGINFIRAAKRVLVADDVGLGKTPQTIGVILYGFKTGEIERVIVLCPSSVKMQWRDEFMKFASPEAFPALQPEIMVVRGTQKQRSRIYAEDWSVLIMTYQTFLRDQKELQYLIPRIQCLVLDEATQPGALKNRDTKTAKAVKDWETLYRIALTATPIENGLHDLFSICEWLDLSVFPGLRWFESEYCKIVKIKVRVPGRSYKVEIPKVIGYQNLSDAKRRMEHLYIRRTFKEVGAQLPDVVSTSYMVELTKEQRVRYDDLRDLINAKKDDDKFAVIGKLVQLREICDSSGLIAGKHYSSKLDELERMMEATPVGEKVVVVSEFRKMTDEIVRRLKQYRPLYLHGGTDDIQRQTIRTTFTDDESHRLLVMTGAGERGLNLQCAGVLVNFELPYNPARIKQRVGRLWRIGSEHETVRVINLIAEDTFEERVLALLNEKEALFEVMFEPDGIDRIGDPVGRLSAAELRRLL